MRMRWLAAGLSVVLVGGGGTAYAVTRDDAAGHYRTVAATTGDVEQVLALTGTVDAANRSDVSFPVAGTVAKVLVEVGDTVRAHQAIATLDTTSLDAAVTRAQAALATAKARLATDKAGQTSTVQAANATSAAEGSTSARTSGSTSTARSAAKPTGGSTSGSTQIDLAELQTQQQAVLDAQSVASAAIKAAKEALATQTGVCADAFSDTSDGDAAMGSGTDGSDSDPGSDSGAETATACQTALQTVQDRQNDVQAAQDALAKALGTLADTLTTAVKTLAQQTQAGTQGNTPTQPQTQPQAQPQPHVQAKPQGQQAQQQAQTKTVSAAQLASDQADIDQAEADLVVAQQQRAGAVLRATRAGKVVSLAATRGAAVNSGDVGAVVIGGNAVTVTTSVSESQISKVRVGQKVRVSAPGNDTATSGTIASVGLVADSSTGTASYPVTVLAQAPSVSLPTGSQAVLQVVVSTREDVVTVPLSAITRRNGAAARVELWDGDTLTSRSVQVGAVGARTVEVTSGLEAGQRVVLANLDRAISGAADSFNERGSFPGPRINVQRGGAGGGPSFSVRGG